MVSSELLLFSFARVSSGVTSDTVLWSVLNRVPSDKLPMTRNFPSRRYLAYHDMYKPIPIEEKISKNLKVGFFGR